MQMLFVFKHKTEYEMRISDLSSDVCSSDLLGLPLTKRLVEALGASFDLWSTVGVGTVVILRFPPNLVGHLKPHAHRQPRSAPPQSAEIGRSSCRDRVCPYVEISVVAVTLHTKINHWTFVKTSIKNQN